MSTDSIAIESGETVDLVITGVTKAYGYGGDTTFRLPAAAGDSEAHFIAIPDGQAGVTITRRTPTDGEPRPGDVWLDRKGAAYFASTVQRVRPAATEVVLIPQDVTMVPYLRWQDVHAGFDGPITLAFRPEPVAEPVESKIWACPHACGYHIADGPVPDGEASTDELINEHLEEEHSGLPAPAATDA